MYQFYGNNIIISNFKNSFLYDLQVVMSSIPQLEPIFKQNRYIDFAVKKIATTSFANVRL